MAATDYSTLSNSLPSRPHPVISEFDEQLNRLEASEATSTSSSSICHKLNGLQALRCCIDKLLQFPLTQQTLSQEQHKIWFHELLDGSLRLLDVCITSKDALLKIKDHAQELQSTLCRKQGGKFEFACEVKKYLTSRKAVKKAIRSALSKLKCMENKHIASPSNREKEIAVMTNMLREVDAVTLTVLKSMLSFISGPQSSSRSTGWSMVSKLMHKRRVVCEEEETDINEITKVDAALHALRYCKTNIFNGITEFENLQNDLQKLELCIQDFEDGLESLYRGLIKSRVSILNILTR
ncbi:hypothetical protein OWV82_021616 [Melia azedarach]|uniref:Uncharacterized protein n=1 Tax=Melia azedarach TaxID=155640 RepID=A0ACC1X2C0_MELAZ|nr:hypothetical protein OWV82_021616 [Melia azedarach]